jgi:hypothetical protein
VCPPKFVDIRHFLLFTFSVIFGVSELEALVNFGLELHVALKIDWLLYVILPSGVCLAVALRTK